MGKIESYRISLTRYSKYCKENFNEIRKEFSDFAENHTYSETISEIRRIKNLDSSDVIKVEIKSLRNAMPGWLKSHSKFVDENYKELLPYILTQKGKPFKEVLKDIREQNNINPKDDVKYVLSGVLNLLKLNSIFIKDNLENLNEELITLIKKFNGDYFLVYDVICEKYFVDSKNDYTGNINQLLKLERTYWEKDEYGNYINKSEKAINFRKCLSCLESNNQTYSTDFIIKKIEEFQDSCDEFLELKIKVKSWENATEEDVGNLLKIARRLGIPTNMREEFYSKYLNLKDYESINELITDFSSLKGVPGVWRIEGINGITYDVAQTIDIGSEMEEYLRRLSFNKNLSDNKIDIENQRYFYNRKKYRNISNDCEKFNFIVEAVNIADVIEREIIEVQIAHDKKAKYWSWAPGQMKRVKERKEVNDNV